MPILTSILVILEVTSYSGKVTMSEFTVPFKWAQIIVGKDGEKDCWARDILDIVFVSRALEVAAP